MAHIINPYIKSPELSSNKLDISQVLKTNYIYNNYDNFFNDAFRRSPHSGLILEAGVFQGTSVRRIAKLAHPRPVFGFDSFEGLPEAWRLNPNEIVPAGTFKLDKIPDMPENVSLVVGLFEQTVEKWVATRAERIAFIHLDADLYASTKTILFEFNKLFQPGAILVFDQICDFTKTATYTNWKNHEWRALCEWIGQNKRVVQVISRTQKRQAAFKVMK